MLSLSVVLVISVEMIQHCLCKTWTEFDGCTIQLQLASIELMHFQWLLQTVEEINTANVIM